MTPLLWKESNGNINNEILEYSNKHETSFAQITKTIAREILRGEIEQ